MVVKLLRICRAGFRRCIDALILSLGTLIDSAAKNPCNVLYPIKGKEQKILISYDAD